MQYTEVDPQAAAVSRIRRRIFVRRKSAEKSLASRIRHLPNPLSAGQHSPVGVCSLCASRVDVFYYWAGVEQQAI